MIPEMTYEQFVERLPALTAEVYRYNDWRDRARMRLLTNIAPRIAKLSTQHYMGCGFHYGLEQELGALIKQLALPVQWSANHCAKIPAERAQMMVREVMVATLIEQVAQAEKSAKEMARKS